MIKSIKNIACCMAIALFALACKKDDGAYNYENEANVFDGNAYAYLKSQTGKYDSLLKVCERVSWAKDTLTNGKAITLFSLTNRNFSVALNALNNLRLSQNKKALSIANLDADQLGILLDRYIVTNKITTDSLHFADGAFLTSTRFKYGMNAQELNSNASGYVFGGPKGVVYSDVKNSQYTKEWKSATTQAVNIETNNAIIHVLSASHEFGFGEFLIRLNK
ncbi:hypothetical protein [Pedobacter ghigonis]|uniref:hypothetical protein n=1 Tax=Pedobacter ghigonis TaxID=2730403 RepID=UPI00158B8578|nr:hypothetical protein [Pedobacter ghigonis]